MSEDLTSFDPTMLDQADLDPEQPVLLAAKTADGPSFRSTVGNLRILFAAGMLELSPDGGIQISDAGIAYARNFR
jgi:hypothetical protein